MTNWQTPEVRLESLSPAHVRAGVLSRDVFTSFRCNCDTPQPGSPDWMAADGGITIYVRQQELRAKPDAGVLQDQYLNINRRLHLPDARDEGTEMGRALGIQSVRMFSNGARNLSRFERYRIGVMQRLPPPTFLVSNARYSPAKVAFASHPSLLTEATEP